MQPDNDADGLVPVVFDGGKPHDVIDVDDPEISAALIYGVQPHCCPGPTHIGVECVDIDHDGSIDIVSDEDGAPLSSGATLATIGPTGWAYTAYHFDGERLQEFVDDHGPDSERPPVPGRVRLLRG
jgi:hypothetical protein